MPLNVRQLLGGKHLDDFQIPPQGTPESIVAMLAAWQAEPETDDSDGKLLLAQLGVRHGSHAPDRAACAE